MKKKNIQQLREEGTVAVSTKICPKVATKSNYHFVLHLRGKEVHDNRHFGVHHTFMKILVVLNLEGGGYHLLLCRCSGIQPTSQEGSASTKSLNSQALHLLAS